MLQLDAMNIIYSVEEYCFKDHLGNHAGYAVVEKQSGKFEMVQAEHYPQLCLAQLAKFKVLTEACKLGKGKAVDIYSDSVYPHDVCHLFSAIWRQRGFKRADGTPIQHLQQILELMCAITMFSKLTIIKCQAHRKGNDFVIKGNNAADEAARLNYKSQTALLAPVVTL